VDCSKYHLAEFRVKERRVLYLKIVIFFYHQIKLKVWTLICGGIAPLPYQGYFSQLFQFKQFPYPEQINPDVNVHNVENNAITYLVFPFEALWGQDGNPCKWRGTSDMHNYSEKSCARVSVIFSITPHFKKQTPLTTPPVLT